MFKHNTSYKYIEAISELENGLHEFGCGTKAWIKNGVVRRANGPALMTADGYYEYRGENGRLHRVDGPAIGYVNKPDANKWRWWYKNEPYETVDEYLAVNDEIDDEDATLLKLEFG